MLCDNSLKMLIFYIKITIIILHYNLFLALIYHLTLILKGVFGPYKKKKQCFVSSACKREM
jgi:hypothetical protein